MTAEPTVLRSSGSPAAGPSPLPTLDSEAGASTGHACPSVPCACGGQAATAEGGRNPVFIVDDSPVVRDRLAALLSELPNVEVVGQADIAFEAIDSIRKLRPSVVLLDISMPGGSGMQVLEAIKETRNAEREARNSALPAPRSAFPLEPMVIMLTNFAHDHYRQKCLQLGADYFFDKSTEFERVTEVLRQLPPSGSSTFNVQRSTLNAQPSSESDGMPERLP